MTISLRPVTRQNLGQILRLNVADDQQHFVASNVYSLAHAYLEPGFVPLAISSDEQPVGFVMQQVIARLPAEQRS